MSVYPTSNHGGDDDRVGYRLDPDDWDTYRSQMHELLDLCIDRMMDYRNLPWKEPPTETTRTADTAHDENDELASGSFPPREGRPMPDVMHQLIHRIMPYATGNTHPQFMGWVHGAGLPSCLDIVSSTMNSNCGGRNHGAAQVEEACINWLCLTAGYRVNNNNSTLIINNNSIQEESETTPFGVLTGGTSQATIYALMCARTRKFGVTQTRQHGTAGPARVYVSHAAHSCVSRAMECIGYGSGVDCIARIPVDANTGAIRIDKLRESLEQDRRADIVALAIVGTAGSVTIGAYDDFEALSNLAKEFGAWLHIDAAFGFWTRVAPDTTIRSLSNNLHLADSIALDAHKWPGVQYDCGALLVRDKHHLRQTMAMRPAYLKSAPRGLAGGSLWFTDYSLDLSRGFRALKLWTAIQVAGTQAIGQVVTDHCKLARHMAELIKVSPLLELAHPVISNICCFRVKRQSSGAVPTASDTASELQMRKHGVFSTVQLGDSSSESCLRAAIVNHRTTRADIVAAIKAIENFIGDVMRAPP